MKNLFGVNIKTDEKTYAPYIARSVSEETAAKQEASDADLRSEDKASKLPLWLRIVQYVCLFVAACIIGGLFQAIGESIGDEPFGEMLERFMSTGAVIIILSVGAVCLVIFIVLLIWGKMRSNDVLQSIEHQAVLDESEKILNASYEELGVPSDADEIDVFSFPFKYNRKGKVVNGSPIAQYMAFSMKIFGDDDNIYFADAVNVIKIPRSSVTKTDVISKRVSFIGWTKEQSYKSPDYKPYKIRVNNVGALFIKWCYSVSLLLDGEEMEIIIPPYEQETLEKYIKLNDDAANDEVLSAQGVEGD